MKIYSLVQISYNWYEFQDFILSTTKKEKIYEATERLKSHYTDWDDKPLEIYFEDNKQDMERKPGYDKSHWFVHVNEE